MAFGGEVGNWNWLEESGGAPLDLMSSSEKVSLFLIFIIRFKI